MPRHARFVVPEVPLHVVQRGNNRLPCFANAADFGLYLSLLQEHAPATGCTLHAYVLMTNHVHLLLTPSSRGSAADLMKCVGQRYVQHYNKAHGRSGTLWEGRFRSSLVDSGLYLVGCQRYIEMNPVRAGMVRDPADYPWSSYRVNALGESSPLVSPHPDFIALAESAAARQKAYRSMFEQAQSVAELERIRSALRGGFALGGARFEQAMAARIGREVARK